MNFNKVINFFKRLPDTIKNAPNDEKAAYGAIGLGIIFLIVGIVLVVLG